MPRREEFLSNMRDALQAQDSDWDISPGTPEFKILEAVAQQLEGISRDGLLSTYHFDIDKKIGIELDLFLSLWGFYRIKAQRATGEVTFRRATVATTDVSIPVGTQVSVPSVGGSPTLYFSTVAGAVISSGNTEVTVPVEAATGGLIGNVASYQISGFGTNLAGVTEVFNASPITGGSNAESDEAFKERFRRTFMRNISGTENQFAGVAYQETAFVNRVNAISAVELYREQLQLTPPVNTSVLNPYFVVDNSEFSGGTITLGSAEADRFPDGEFFVGAFSDGDLETIHKFTRIDEFSFSSVPEIDSADNIDKLAVVFPTTAQDVKFVYPQGGETVGVALGSQDEILAKGGADSTNSPDYIMYTFDSDFSIAEAAGCSLPIFYFTPGGVARLGGPGTIVDITYEYTPRSSRNNPPDIVNKLDVFVDGIDERSINEQMNMPQADENIFDHEQGIDSDNFLREDGVTHPKSGHLFTPLGRSPILSLGTELTVQRFISEQSSDYKYSLPNATTYYRDEDYWLVKKTAESDSVENLRGSQRSVEGIEWKTPIRLEDGSENETYIFPRRGALENSSDLAAPFAITPNEGGDLNGFYGYVVTWEVDGRESLPSNVVVNEDELVDQSVLVQFDDFHSRYPGVYIDNEASGKTIYRRFYRSKMASSEDAARLGPFYLVNIVRNNSENAWWLDNKADDDLGMTQPPKVPPPHMAPLNIDYNYNALIERLDSQMETVRLVGQDVLSHQADLLPIKFNLAVVLVPNASVVSARNSIQSALESFLNRKQFAGELQTADLYSTLDLVAEIDNVRLLTEEESANEVQRLELTSNGSGFTSTDTLIFTVDNYSTSTLSADENSYSIREALEALPTLNEGDTYAAPLTNTLSISPTVETELVVQGNANTRTLHELVQGDPATPIYLQITQFGDDNKYKDEIVRVTGSDIISDDPVLNTVTVAQRALAGGTATLTTTSAHGLNAGDTATVTGVDTLFNGTISVNSVTSTTLSYLIQDTSTTVVQTASSGTVSYSSPVRVSASIVAKQLEDEVATLTTKTLHRFLPGDRISVNLSDARFDAGTATITAIGSTSISYVIGGTATVPTTAVTPAKTITGLDDVSENTFNATVVATQVVKDGTVSIGVITTKFVHGFQQGDLISVSGLEDTHFNTDGEVEIISTTSFTISYGINNSVEATNKITLASNKYGFVTTRIRQQNIKFDVERGQLGSNKYEYGDDVTNAESAAWIHVLGDVAVCRSANSNTNPTAVTYTLTFLPNGLTGVNNWGNRSLIDLNGNQRVSVAESGDFSSTGLQVRTPGRGYGIEILANNLHTLLERHEEDIYFLSSELPTFGGLDISIRARNTF